MTLVSVWLHLLGVAVWVGGLVCQSHVLLPLARSDRAAAATVAAAAARARPVTWVAIAVVVLTGFYNVTRLGPLEQVMDSGAGLILAGKLLLVIAAVALAGQRDFAQVSRLARAAAAGQDLAPALTAIAWLDRIVLLLMLAIVYLGLAVGRAAGAS